MAKYPVTQIKREMNVAKDLLSARQIALVDHLLRGGKNSHDQLVDGYLVLSEQLQDARSQLVQAALVKELRFRMVTHDAPRARIIAMGLMEDGNTPAATRWAIAKDFMRPVLPPEPTKGDSGPSKDISEMKGDEMRQEIVRLEREIAARSSAAKIIDIDTDDAPTDTSTDAMLLKELG